DEAVDRAARDSSLWSTYAEEIDRESARELLAGRLAEAAAVAAEEPPDAPPPPPPEQPKGKKKGGNAVVGYLKSREGRSMVNTVARGVFGLLKKR
ncbi:MAG: helicase HerA-like domain-containing protein, partial [Acidimicrobiales bacterium]